MSPRKLLRALLIALVLIASHNFGKEGAAQEPAAKQTGYAVEVTDVSGSKMLVYGFSFGYTYSYTLPNCIGFCSETSHTNLSALPINEGCGTMMIPLAKVKTITQISSKSYGEPYDATITFEDGRALKAKFGQFGGKKLSTLNGKSALGEYSLPIEKAAQIVFQHDKDVSPRDDSAMGSNTAKSGFSVQCTNGTSYSLSKADFYSGNDYGTISGYGTRTIALTVGESNIDMDFSRVQSLTRSGEAGRDNKFTLATTTGETISVSVSDYGKYIGGYRDGYFYYVKLDELKSINRTQ